MIFFDRMSVKATHGTPNDHMKIPLLGPLCVVDFAENCAAPTLDVIFATRGVPRLVFDI